MSAVMEQDIGRWTTTQQAVRVPQLIQGRTKVAMAPTSAGSLARSEQKSLRQSIFFDNPRFCQICTQCVDGRRDVATHLSRFFTLQLARSYPCSAKAIINGLSSIS